MPAHEIKSTDWKAFCEKFLELHRGTQMSLTQIEPSGKMVEVMKDMPLRRIWMEDGECSDRVFLNFEQDQRREVTHEIVEPIHIKLREETGGQKALQFDAESGSTLLVFRSGHVNELIEEFPQSADTPNGRMAGGAPR